MPPLRTLKHVGQHGNHDAALQQGLGNARSNESADWLDFRHDHGGLNPLSLRSGRSGGRGANQHMNSSTEIAGCALADPAAVEVEDEFGAALYEDCTGINGAQGNDQPILPVLDEVVDDASLQLEWHHLEQKNADGQQQQEQLVQTTCFQNIAEYVRGHFTTRNGCPPRWRLRLGRHKHRFNEAESQRTRSPVYVQSWGSSCGRILSSRNENPPIAPAATSAWSA